MAKHDLFRSTVRHKLSWYTELGRTHADARRIDAGPGCEGDGRDRLSRDAQDAGRVGGVDAVDHAGCVLGHVQVVDADIDGGCDSQVRRDCECVLVDCRQQSTGWQGREISSCNPRCKVQLHVVDMLSLKHPQFHHAFCQARCRRLLQGDFAGTNTKGCGVWQGERGAYPGWCRWRL